MPGLSFYDRQHVQKVLAQQSVISNIFNQFILSVSPYLRKWNDTGKSSVWVRNQSIEKAVDRELMNLESLLKANISSFQKDAWERSNTKNDDFIRKYIEGMSISSAVKEGMFTHNLSALAALQNSVDAGGMSLSNRVWNIGQQTKKQLEFYLDSGVSVGRNANGISSDIRQLLHEPDKRFRRVRDEEGKLVPSQPMKDYHPGQGVYRSAYMNALRTSATTTNTAYRSADYERWSKQDFTLGIEIHRSANHKGPCKICDAMVGKYPKTFKFTGFHPFCICFATPIVMEPEDFADYLFTDEVPEQLVVTSIPQRAQEFVKENKDGLQSAYWYQDNFDDGGKLQRAPMIQRNKPEAMKVSGSKFVESETIEEATKLAKNIGVRYVDYSDLSLEMANNLNKALNTIPQEDLPLFVGSAKKLQLLSEITVSKKGYHGLTVDGIVKIQENGKWNVESGTLVGINGKSINAISKAKEKMEADYYARTGHRWRFNTNGESTSFHEIGHVFDMKHSISSNSQWKDISKKWAEESQCDMLKTPSEAFAEAWAARNTGKKLPAYINEYLERYDRKDSTYKMVCSDASAKLKPTSIKEISHIQSKMERIVSEHPEYFPRGYKGITAVSREHAYMSTDINGDIIVNFATDKNGFNAGESLVSAFDKIKKGVKLTEHEEYSVEVLWHEVLHNKSKNTAVLPDINSPSGFSRTVAETVNQLVARHSYNDLLKQLGSSAKHKAWVLDNGYGYKEMVSNLRALISKAGINEKAFVREANKILMEDYTDIDVKIRGLLKRMYKGNKDVEGVFDMIEIDNFSRFLKILD